LGCSAGAVIGSFAGPIGAGVGLVAGAILGGIGGNLAGRFLTDTVLNLLNKHENEDKAREEMLLNARKILQVTLKTDWEKVIHSWRRKILDSHPDRHPDANVEESESFRLRFIEVHQAFCLLRDERQGKGGSFTSEKDIERIAQLES